MKIYTRAGDGGETSLIGGRRVSKAHPRLEAVGTLDELNALIGILRLHVSDESLADVFLLRVQKDIFTMGAALANPDIPPGVTDGPERPLECSVEAMEADIDRLWAMGPELKSFLLPSGCAAAVHAHHARTVCRRAERTIVPLCSEASNLEWVSVYLNRLGDWLFALANSVSRLRPPSPE
ncbi:MAG: cob(I)yrinic acid a,c-diamide adenosyltransferase [Holophagales bacterium]|jgi:cob(I)alamin adenosyltransferase|nr:cob(I)yrinic acid a,c-diamide adenosyltransferase [Holophagales bacterium]